MITGGEDDQCADTDNVSFHRAHTTDDQTHSDHESTSTPTQIANTTAAIQDVKSAEHPADKSSLDETMPTDVTSDDPRIGTGEWGDLDDDYQWQDF